MDKQYKNLMEQQSVGEEVNAEFYEKLGKTERKRKPLGWKVALIAACLAIMIPLTAFAVEHIFGVPAVKLGDTVHFTNMNGYMVHFENVQSYPLSALPEDVQAITEYKNQKVASWKAAEDTLDIDLLNSTFLEGATINSMPFDDTGDTHCVIHYRASEGQLFFVGVNAYYKYDGLQLDMKAKLTVEHPAMTEEDKLALQGVEGAVKEPANVKTTYENYTTKEGIPAVILRWDYETFDRYLAVFAVNDITYELTAFTISEKTEATALQTLKDALDGFELN